MAIASEAQTLYELCWVNAPGGVFAFDAGSGELINVNPGAEKLSGYSREELLQATIDRLHPEAERERVKAEFLKPIQEARFCSSLHLERKDGQRLPVRNRFWKSVQLGSRLVNVCAYFDVSDRVEEEHRLSTQNWALSAYAGAALALGRAENAEELLQSICAAVTSHSAYALAWIGIAEDDAEKTVRVAAAAGSGIGYMDGLQVSWRKDDAVGNGPVGLSIRTGKVTILNDSESAESFAPWRARARQSGIRSNASIPFCINGGGRGVFMIYSTYPNAFEPAAIEVFENLAGQIGHGLHALEQEELLRAEQIRLETMQKQLSGALSAMVSPIVAAMEMRDPYTAGHQSRVAEIAVAIGREMGWPEERLHGLRVAALVHDIGKISIPTEILTRQGRLTPIERLLIRDHPETGHTILKGIPFAWPIAEIVRQHHEKLDGSGYPFGLAGDAILPEARILTVADIVEAMASDRPYRRAISVDKVLEELQSQAGTLLDAEVVRACVALARARRLGLPAERNHRSRSPQRAGGDKFFHPSSN